MTEIPEHLLKRARAAQDKAAGYEIAWKEVEEEKRQAELEKLEKRKVARDTPPGRRFHFDRSEDVHNTSGTGMVAWGYEFPDGTVAVRWNSAYASTALYNNIKELQIIHGHQGRTKVVWDDPEVVL